MSRMRIAVLIIALVAALGIVLSLNAAAVQAAPAAYDTSRGPDIVAMPGSLNVYVSEDALWQQFYHAAEYHDAGIASRLLRIVNMRHEYRVHLPR